MRDLFAECKFGSFLYNVYEGSYRVVNLDIDGNGRCFNLLSWTQPTNCILVVRNIDAKKYDRDDTRLAREGMHDLSTISGQ